MGWYLDDEGCVDFQLTVEEFEDVLENYDGDVDEWIDDHYDEAEALYNEDVD